MKNMWVWVLAILALVLLLRTRSPYKKQEQFCPVCG